MRQDAFEEVCSATAGGERRLVENTQLRYTGEVVGCAGDKLVVEAFGHRYDWPRNLCRPSDGNQNPLGPSSNA